MFHVTLFKYNDKYTKFPIVELNNNNRNPETASYMNSYMHVILCRSTDMHGVHPYTYRYPYLYLGLYQFTHPSI